MNRKEIIENFLNWAISRESIAIYDEKQIEYISYCDWELIETLVDEYLDRR